MASEDDGGGAPAVKKPTLRDPRVPRFPVIYEHPTFEQVKNNLSKSDLIQWGVVGIACFPMGFLVGRQLGRSMARPAMWFTGVVGSILGGMLAYQNSELRLQGYGRNDEEVARYLQHHNNNNNNE